MFLLWSGSTGSACRIEQQLRGRAADSAAEALGAGLVGAYAVTGLAEFDLTMAEAEEQHRSEIAACYLGMHEMLRRRRDEKARGGVTSKGSKRTRLPETLPCGRQ